ncbi:MFS 1 domain containing protein [Pyrenophora tritici-repentis]|nr:MFS 1 domain containing protein [Pyrenophora tritici-repentis]
MAFFLQYRAIKCHVKEELQRVTEFSDPFSAATAHMPMTSDEAQELGDLQSAGKSEPFTRIPGITLMEDGNNESCYQVDWVGPDDPHNPKQWSTLHRVGATLLVCTVAFVATVASAIDSAVITRASADFGVSEVAELLATALFLVGFGLGALLPSPLSELVGRYPVYLGSLLVFACWILGAALAPNFGGSVGDLWNPIEKTFAFPLFAIPAFGGPVFGPVIGAYIGYEQDINWRWTEWITLIMIGAVFVLILLFKRESFAPRLLHYKASHFRKLTGNNKFKTAAEASHSSLRNLFSRCFSRPFLLYTQPVVMAFTLYLVIVYIILFTFLDGYPCIFTETYGINEGLFNICFIGLFVGIALAVVLAPIVYRITIRQLQRDGDDGSGSLINRESRLYFAMIGALALSIGLFWMGWTDYPSISIWSPLAASLLIGFSNICVFMSAYMYIIDSYEAYAASVLTLVALVRYLAAGGITVVGIPMYRNLGTHWTLTVLGCISALALPIPYLLYRFGPSLRKRTTLSISVAKMARQGRNGKGRKTGYEAKVAHEKALAAMQPKLVNSENLKISQHLEQRAIVAQPESALMCLPGEIRNKIYHYVFQADGDLEFMHQSVRLPYARFDAPLAKKSYIKVRGDKSGKEFNQVKYVCRGLYNETICLEFKHNTIFFDSNFIETRGVLGAAQVFNMFIKECGPKASWLSRVELSHHTTEKFFFTGLKNTSSTFEGIEEFCRENSKCTVRFFVFDFKITPGDVTMFFDHGFDIYWVLRHKAFPDFHRKLALPDRLFTMEKKEYAMKNSNLKIFPRQGTVIDETFMNTIAKIPRIGTHWYHLCIDLAEDWVLNGL